jgi:hypothetical protein
LRANTWPELLFEQVGAVEPLVRGGDPGQLGALAFGEVDRVLPQRETGALELCGQRFLPRAAGVVPHLAADLVEGLSRPLHDMKRVDAQRRPVAALPDHVTNPLQRISADQPDPLATLVAEQVEELTEGLLVMARGRPHQPASVVIDDHHQIPVTALVGDLVDPDTRQPVEVMCCGSCSALATARHVVENRGRTLTSRGSTGEPARPLVLPRAVRDPARRQAIRCHVRFSDPRIGRWVDGWTCDHH